MKTKISKVINMLIGFYLIYSGSRLIISIQEVEPQHGLLFMALSVIFILFGVISAGYSIFYLYRQFRKEYGTDPETGDEHIEEFNMDDIRIIDGTVNRDSEQE